MEEIIAFPADLRGGRRGAAEEEEEGGGAAEGGREGRRKTRVPPPRHVGFSTRFSFSSANITFSKYCVV